MSPLAVYFINNIPFFYLDLPFLSAFIYYVQKESAASEKYTAVDTVMLRYSSLYLCAARRLKY